MKIDAINIVKSTNRETQPSGRAGDSAFGDLLNQALNNTPAGQAAITQNPLPAAMPVFVSPQPQDTTLRQEAMEHAQRILAGLDAYQAQLGNAAASLKEVGVSLERLEDEVRQAAPMLERLEQGDSLLEILESVSGLAMAEAIKFRRGDYS